ncbi:MAG: hypothetical protein HY548_05295 [Elusimicrobia bacterium]|nr:hypothetical protein [Elusimicrobiota bacterium]
MIQDRRTYLSIWLASLFVMAGAFFVMQDRHRMAKRQLADLPVKKETIPPKAIPAEKTVEEKQPAKVEPSKTNSAKTTRHILFTYRNSKPSRVDLVGDFTNWEPKPMKKGANHVWSVSADFLPGDYTYNYVVDGKVVRDPNNPRTAAEGRSLLTVKALE